MLVYEVEMDGSSFIPRVEIDRQAHCAQNNTLTTHPMTAILLHCVLIRAVTVALFFLQNCQ